MYLYYNLNHVQSIFFFFNDTATTEIYTLSLHDALPIWRSAVQRLFKEGLESDDTFGNRSAWLHATERSQHRTGNGSALHLFVQLFGKQDIYRDQGGHFKVGGKNAGNSRDLAIKGDCLAEDAGITRIAVFPEREI